MAHQTTLGPPSAPSSNHHPSPHNTTPTPSPLFSLPAELRLQIYTALLIDTHSYIVPIPNLPPSRAYRSKLLSPAILRTCKSVHDEAIDLLYAGNWWAIRTWPVRYCRGDLLRYIGKVNAGRIRRVWTGNLGVALAGEEETGRAGGGGGGVIKNVVRRYREQLGIEWGALTVWVAWGKDKRSGSEGEGDGSGSQRERALRRDVVDEGGGSLVAACDDDTLEKLGVRGEWYEGLGGEEGELWWIAKRTDVKTERGVKDASDVEMAGTR